MKRLQIYIEPSSDDALGAEAAREGTSKAEIIRRLVNEHFGKSAAGDSIDGLVGCFDAEPGNHDDVIYGR